MNIEIANRLVELRKKYGYSQEELASKLGISRQAISKWERAESSPDTDNLICLAKLYDCSLDELLKTDDSIDDIVKNKEIDEDEKYVEYVNILPKGIHVVKGNKEVKVGFNGIHVRNGAQECHIGSKFHDFDSTLKTERYNKIRKRKQIGNIISSIFSILVIIAYLCIGFICDIWHPSWLLFLLIPVFESLVTSIITKNPSAFAYPILVTVIYLAIGFYLDYWHPGWVVFLTIPIYYTVLPKNRNRIIYKNIDGKVYKDFGKKDEEFVVSFDDEDIDDERKVH